MYDHSRFAWIDGFAEELDELVYEGISNWFVSFRSPVALFSGHWSYLVVHLSIIACGILTFKHAKANGSRFFQFWWGALLQGILSENGITATRYWHAQALIMLFGKKLPLHMVFYYPTILYLCAMAVQRFKLNPLSEPAAIGLLAMIMEIPFRIISVKFLHVTYHDSEPLYVSKFYGVPWVEIFSDLVFASSYVGAYYSLKYTLLSEDHIKWENVEYAQKEAMLTAASGVASTIWAFFQKLLFFHLPHDSFNINPPTCLLFLCCIYFSVVFYSVDGKESSDEDKEPEGKVFLYYTLGIYLGCLLYIAMLVKPQNEISIGAHEPTGDCTTLICTRTPLGKVSKRRKYLCIDEVQERSNFLYNFDCIPEGPPFLNAIWYTICGTAMRNRAQFFANIFSFAILTSAIFLKALLGEDEKEMIMRKLSELKLYPSLLRREARREGGVTFEEPPTEPPREQET